MDSVAIRLRLAALCCVLAMVPAILRAQAPSGEIRVEVKDPSGAPVEAAGRIESITTKSTISFLTDPKGAYTIAHLPYGRYRLEVSKNGFATQSTVVDLQSAA